MKLTEILMTEKLRLDEGEGLTRMHFMVLCGDQPTGNGRTYSSRLLKGVADKFNATIERSPSYGGTAHPKPGETLEVDDVSHRIDGLEWDEDEKKLFANILLLDTKKGQNLRAILKAGGQLGVSARGEGQVENGQVKDYVMKGIDFTLSPANEGSWVSSRDMCFESAALDERYGDEAVLMEKYRQAVLMAGFKGSFDAYRSAMATAPRPTMVSESEEAPAIGQELDEPMTREEAELFEDTLKQDFTAVHDDLVFCEWDVDPQVVTAFNPFESQWYLVPWDLDDKGQFTFGKPEVLEA
jgi:hypothetical protein